MKTLRSINSIRSLAMLLSGLLLTATHSLAADRYWDGVDTGPDADGGNGTWNTTTTSWDDAATGGANVAFTAGDNAIFGGAQGTVTFGAVFAVGSVTFNTPGYIILPQSGGNRTHTITGLTTLPTTGTTTFNQSANNNRFQFNGGIDLNGSNLSVNLRGTSNGGSPSTASGVSGSGNLSFRNELCGANNSARFVLSGTNTFTGNTTVDGVVLDLNSITALGDGSSTLTINATVSGITTVIRNSSAAALTLTNNNAMAWNGDFTFSGDSARTGTGSGTARDLNLGTGAVTLGGNRIVTTTANTLTVGGVIGDGGNAFSLTKAGAGTMILNGVNTYTGNTSVTAGTLRISTPSLADTASVSVDSGAKLDLDFEGSDTVGSLFLNGIQQATGSYGSSDSDATFVDNNRFSGTGSIIVTIAPDPLLVVAGTSSYASHSSAINLNLPVSNNGTTQNLSITSVTVGGTHAANFSITSALPIVIPPGGASNIAFTFTPATGPGSYTATFEITSTDLTQSPKTVTINVTDNPDPWVQSTNTNYVNNGATAGYSLPISNIGNAKTLNLSSVSIGGFDATTITGLSHPATIAPGGNGQINFTFTPDFGPGAYNVTFTINSDDPATPAKAVSLVLSVQDPLIAVSGTSLNFGMFSTNPGPQTLNLTVSNNGGARNLVISDTPLTGAPEFAVTSAPASIAPGANGTIEVTFSPGTAGGRFRATLEIFSNDFHGTIPKISLTGFVDPSGTVLARFDFDPNSVVDLPDFDIVDVDGSGMAAWATGNLIDRATGTGALSASNQGTTNRNLRSGLSGNYLAFSSNRESDAQTPLAGGGGNKSTWTTFTITPDAGGGSINFTDGSAVIDTYINTDQGGTTSTNWTLYYSTDGGGTWNSLGTSAGASLVGSGTAGPVGVAWNLSPLGIQTAPVAFIVDPVTTGGSNGTLGQRGTGFDNLVLTASSVTPGSGSGSFASWATTNGVTGGPNGDSDDDGIQNLVEYALALNFAGPDGSAGSLVGNLLSFTKRALAVTNGDVTYTIETSSNLIAWTPATPDVNDGTTISLTLPTGQGKIFARLLVTQTL